MEKKKVALLKNFWGIGQFGNSIYTYLETAFFTIFLTDVAKFPIALVGGILTFTATADFIIAPLMGRRSAYADRGPGAAPNGALPPACHSTSAAGRRSRDARQGTARSHQPRRPV